MVFRRETCHEYLAVAFVPEINYSFFFWKDGFNGGRTSKEPIANNYSNNNNNKNKNCSAIMFLFILIALNN